MGLGLQELDKQLRGQRGHSGHARSWQTVISSSELVLRLIGVQSVGIVSNEGNNPSPLSTNGYMVNNNNNNTAVTMHHSRDAQKFI